MRSNRKWLLLILCLLCSALLTGCYTDNDPWPTANDLSPTLTPSPVPTEATQATPTPAPTELPSDTMPPATQEPQPDDAVDTAPNFNG